MGKRSRRLPRSRRLKRRQTRSLTKWRRALHSDSTSPSSGRSRSWKSEGPPWSGTTNRRLRCDDEVKHKARRGWVRRWLGSESHLRFARGYRSEGAIRRARRDSRSRVQNQPDRGGDNDAHEKRIQRPVPKDRTTRQAAAVRSGTVREQERSVRLLPHAGNGVHWTSELAQCDHCRLPGFGPDAVQLQEAPDSYLPTFAPELHYNQPRGDFVGGAFWDSSATATWLKHRCPGQAVVPALT